MKAKNGIEKTHLSGLAKTRCPKVTKLVSWLDMNHANEETLHGRIKQSMLNKHNYREKNHHYQRLIIIRQTFQ